jgi:hypothetical protein
MKLDFCAVCGSTHDLQQHHIEPVVFSGISRQKKKGYDPKKQIGDCNSDETFAHLFNLGVISEDGEITLCAWHHSILHGVVRFEKAKHSEMIKAGLKRAIDEGKKLGRPSNVTDEIIQKVYALKKDGLSIHAIAKSLRIGVGTTSKILSTKTIQSDPSETYITTARTDNKIPLSDREKFFMKPSQPVPTVDEVVEKRVSEIIEKERKKMEALKPKTSIEHGRMLKRQRKKKNARPI